MSFNENTMFGVEVIDFHTYHYSTKVLPNLQSNKNLLPRLEMSHIGNSIKI